MDSGCEQMIFLLTPLREGRHGRVIILPCKVYEFLLTPLREGRRRKERLA